MKARVSLRAPTEITASVQRHQQRLTVSVYIPRKENLVKLHLTYFTAVLRAPEEYVVRRDGFNLFYLILCSRSVCCLIGELAGILCRDTKSFLVQTQGALVGDLSLLSCWKGQ